MHQRTWLALASLPLVALYSWPVVVQNLGSSRAQRPAAQQEARPGTSDPLAGLADIQDVLGIVRDNYVDRPDMERVVGGGIMATLERAHPLNAYLSPEDLRLPDPGPAGLGLKVVKRGIYAQVVAVRPGSPAGEAGVLPGDVIRKIDGDSVGAMSAWTLERRLRGAEGSEVVLLRWVAATGNLAKLTLRRALPAPVGVTVRTEAKVHLVALPDLQPGRAAELKAALQRLDRDRPVVLDLRGCMGGDLAEAALAGGLFTASGAVFATVQEAGPKEGEAKEQPLQAAPAGLEAFPKVAALVGPATFGAPEALAAFLKKAGQPVYGERTYALGVDRSRVALKQGGAVELVNRRWVGAGGEKLDRAGVEPTIALKGLKPAEDPLPRLLPLLDAKPDPKTEGASSRKTASLGPSARRAGMSEVA